MAVNIGEILREKTRRNLRAGFVTWLAFAGSVYFADLQGLRLLPLILFLPFFCIVLKQMFFVRCPKCSGNVGQLLTQTMAPGRLKTHVTNCPFCGVSFNEKLIP